MHKKARFPYTFLAALCTLAFLPACSTTATQGIATDLASPAGKQLTADLFSSAVNITAAALAKGTNPDADVAAANSLAGLLESYSTLPTTSTQLGQLTHDAASTSTAVAGITPQLVTLIDQAKAKGGNPTEILQTVASGVYSATGVVGQ